MNMRLRRALRLVVTTVTALVCALVPMIATAASTPAPNEFRVTLGACSPALNGTTPATAYMRNTADSSGAPSEIVEILPQRSDGYRTTPFAFYIGAVPDGETGSVQIKSGSGRGLSPGTWTVTGLVNNVVTYRVQVRVTACTANNGYPPGDPMAPPKPSAARFSMRASAVPLGCAVRPVASVVINGRATLQWRTPKSKKWKNLGTKPAGTTKVALPKVKRAKKVKRFSAVIRARSGKTTVTSGTLTWAVKPRKACR